jgi:hypothetical protein
MFLFWFYLIGILIAVFQDLKRKEIDNWLNYTLFVGGTVFLIFNAIFIFDYFILFYGLFSLVVVAILANIFYYGRIYGGGDTKLLIAMFALFAFGVSSFFEISLNIGVFVFLLFFVGSLYGLVFSFVLFAKNFKKTSKEFSKSLKNRFVITSFGLSGLFLVLSFVSPLFFGLFLFSLFGSLLFIFVKSIENVSMIKSISTKDLRWGDWLFEDVKIGGRIIKSHWEGLTKSQARFLNKYDKKVRIKDGMAYAPVFLLALILYYFRNAILGLVF